MKKLMILLIAAVSISSVSAQTISADAVPQVVKNALAAKYPDAKTVVWKQSDPGFVECNFISGSKKINSMFAAHGDWVSSDWEITKAEVPAAANDYLTAAQFGDAAMKYFHSETVAKGVGYTVEAKKNGKTYEFVFDSAGKIVMRSLKED